MVMNTEMDSIQETVHQVSNVIAEKKDNFIFSDILENLGNTNYGPPLLIENQEELLNKLKDKKTPIHEHLRIHIAYAYQKNPIERDEHEKHPETTLFLKHVIPAKPVNNASEKIKKLIDKHFSSNEINELINRYNEYSFLSDKIIDKKDLFFKLSEEFLFKDDSENLKDEETQLQKKEKFYFNKIKLIGLILYSEILSNKAESESLVKKQVKQIKDELLRPLTH